MTEREIRKKAIEKLEREGFVYWFPATTWGERDIMGIFDFIAFKGSEILLVQMTTLNHLSHRRRKIQDFYLAHGLKTKGGEVWAWDKNKDKFRIEKQ